MEEIEAFVRKLCAEGDLSILTKKLIRTQYQAHYNKTTVTREEKDKINEVLETVIQELADQAKARKKAAALAAMSSDDDQPLKRRPATPVRKSRSASGDDCEDFTPVKTKKLKKKNLRMKLAFSDEDDDGDDVPLRLASGIGVSARDIAKDSDGDDAAMKKESDSDTDLESPVAVKVGKKRGRNQMMESSGDEEDEPPKPRSASVNTKGRDEDNQTSSDVVQQSEDDFTPIKTKVGKKRRRKQAMESSEDEEDKPLKRRSVSANTKGRKEDHQTSCDDLQPSEDDSTPLKIKVGKKRDRKRAMEMSEDEEDEPLKPRSASVNTKGREEDDQTSSDVIQLSEDNSKPMKTKVGKKRGKKQAMESSEDEEDEPLKPRSRSVKTKGREKDYQTSSDVVQLSDDDSTPMKTKTSLKAPKLVFVSSDDGVSPMKVKLKPAEDESDLDTSSLSSADGEDGVSKDICRPSGGPRIKFTMKKVQHYEKAMLQAKGKASKKAKAAESGKEEESSYLKRLKLICRKVGIFVRNEVHFAGCRTDKEKIKRLQETLKKAGMEGRPSFSKVDSVNLKREAEALDTTNIIQTSGRPRRQQKGMFDRPASLKTSLTPIKQQFSRIKDVISDSCSD